MRIVLVGPKAARDRLRPELLGAGFEIVAELIARPEADAEINGADAVIEARAPSHPPSPIARSARGYGGQASGPLEPLTPREQDVLVQLADGLSNKAIAEALGISDQTVKFHVAAIIGKLGATNRTDVVRRAIRRGLVAI